MTRAERPDGSPIRQPKPSWGPGKSAALSIIAFAVIFGAFAYVERAPGVGHASVTHDIAGVIRTAVGKYHKAIVTATADTFGASASAEAATTVAQVAQVAPVAPVMQVAPVTSAASATPAVSAAAEPDAPPPPTARAAATRTRPAQVPSTTLAASAHAAPAHGRAARPGDAHRSSRTQALARTRNHPASAPTLRPQSYLAGTAHLQAASVTRNDLEGARALAKARSCAQIDEWHCVEHNASRALAIDPKNSESRALLGQAIRNRL
ncbi:hypothetical protein [Burkholderia cepacia]|uniref:Uncharacterized protein n=1 Tax=Burkholderia cepacia GG4 TaxID=1009846 RepID=A0A9W3PBU0_BURCE|nr:hypothetical protein [Burkholderia cepacia]AFQ50901.1 hypothetical protein GEM_4511 [Burkholderia cepacia GG4]